MNLDSIKANGISWYEPAKSIIPHLTTQIGIFKMRHSDGDILEKLTSLEEEIKQVKFKANSTPRATLPPTIF